MKKYKINNYIVKANSPIEALKAVQTLKDSKVKDSIYEMTVRGPKGRLTWYIEATSENEALSKINQQPGHRGSQLVKSKIISRSEAERVGAYIIDSKIKDYQPPFAIWVKDNGQWKLWGGSNSQYVDRDAYLKKGYDDVIVVKNGESPKDSVNTITDERPDKVKIDMIQKNARNVGGRLASVVVDEDIDDKGLYISRIYISTAGTWLETPAEADNYLQQLQSATAYFKENYKYKGK